MPEEARGWAKLNRAATVSSGLVSPLTHPNSPDPVVAQGKSGLEQQRPPTTTGPAWTAGSNSPEAKVITVRRLTPIPDAVVEDPARGALAGTDSGTDRLRPALRSVRVFLTFRPAGPGQPPFHPTEKFRHFGILPIASAKPPIRRPWYLPALPTRRHLRDPRYSQLCEPQAYSTTRSTGIDPRINPWIVPGWSVVGPWWVSYGWSPVRLPRLALDIEFGGL